MTEYKYQWKYKTEREHMVADLLRAPVINTGTWQAMDISKSRHHDTHELMDVEINYKVPNNTASLAHNLRPDVEWAEQHFVERIGGEPVNPPESASIWPHAVRSNTDHTTRGKFDHTYPERFWPRYAGAGFDRLFASNQGIRFPYGDLDSVISLLRNNPSTRQAYLPVWFPEDTGGTDTKLPDGKPIRVPCTLGYHFMIRNDILTCRYFMRSCDAYRHLTNDIYLASRLMQHIAWELTSARELIAQPPVNVGNLIMYISSLHLFVADDEKMESWASKL